MTDESPYTLEFRILAAVWYFESDQSRHAMGQVRIRLRERYNIEAPEGRVIKGWTDKLFSTGSITDKQRPGRPTARGDATERISQHINAEPCSSVRRVSNELNIPLTTAYRIMRQDLSLKPWKQTKVQFLSPDDHINRVNCCQEIINAYRSPRLSDWLFFSDECAIYSSARAHNVVFWSNENPHFWDQVMQHPPKIMVWAAMAKEYLIGPFFIEGRMDSQRYIELLKNDFIPELRRRGIYERSHLQQDGAPPHTAYITRQFLNDNFPNRWVGKFGPIQWPARSPDLTSCDNALWSIIKKSVLAEKARSTQDLKQAIRNAFANFKMESLPKIHARTFRRLQLCIDIDGLQVDPYD